MDSLSCLGYFARVFIVLLVYRGRMGGLKRHIELGLVSLVLALLAGALGCIASACVWASACMTLLVFRDLSDRWLFGMQHVCILM